MIDSFPPVGGPIQLFYTPIGAKRLPTISRAEGIYMWDTAGKRYVDASSGPICCNLGHGNRRVIEAGVSQMSKVSFASRNLFENEPNIQLAELLATLSGPGFERAFIVSGGSEATEAALKFARQYAVVTGRDTKWKALARMPSYHGASLGAVSVTGDPESEYLYGEVTRIMPKLPAPFTYRLAEGQDAKGAAEAAARALEEAILAEGPETVLAFIMEPVGGLATGALVAHDVYYRLVRDICTRHGVLLIYDEVMSGAGRTGKFLSAEHWPLAKPDMCTLAKGVSAGYTPLGVVMVSAEMTDILRNAGGFVHGHTYSANPLSCAIAHAALTELVERDLMSNAAEMGELLKAELIALMDRCDFIGDVRGKGLLTAIEVVSNKERKSVFASGEPSVGRLVQLGIERGLLLYTRRTAYGRYGEWLMIAPPLIVTREQVHEIVGLLEATFAAFKAEKAGRP
ncbi:MULTISPECIES: aspartate aminotransferase family protein [unclassified Bradyrhizobium]|uniref:aminotransferase family protein n=1 Tax=unclassified Bradyrhizobium TaxID=2631580 RepID=UPI0029160E28|nr:MULTISPECIES: aminotransferase class III-fold pyridoxal phosphate-dependent enzyme [unclassified Bradyrhizobium]